MSDKSLVAAWYDQNASLEHSRLIDNRLEYSITLRAIDHTISQFPLYSPLKIADIGGGTGRYGSPLPLLQSFQTKKPPAVELAKRGHKVTLSDISSSELELARQYTKSENVSLEDVIQADASQLRSTFSSFREEEYDIVLLLGPLYHLLEEQERLNALQDCAAMLKKGGTLIAAFVTKYAHLRDLAQRDPKRLFREKAFYEGYLGDGKYTRNPATVSFHMDVGEIRGLFEKVGEPKLEVKRVVGCEGFLGGELSKGLDGLGEEEYETWVDVVWDMAGDRSVLGASDHMLVVAKRG